MTTITAKIPARKVAGRVYRARIDTFTADAEGRWTLQDPDLGAVAVSQAEVIDVCKRATNWAEIRAEHFPMHGFHS